MENSKSQVELLAKFLDYHKTGTIFVSGKTDTGKTTFLKDVLEKLDGNKKILFASTSNSNEIDIKDNYITHRLEKSEFKKIYEDSIRYFVDYLVLDDLNFDDDTIEFINKCSEHTNVVCAFHNNKEGFRKQLVKLKNIKGAFNLNVQRQDYVPSIKQ